MNKQEKAFPGGGGCRKRKGPDIHKIRTSTKTKATEGALERYLTFRDQKTQTCPHWCKCENCELIRMSEESDRLSESTMNKEEGGTEDSITCITCYATFDDDNHVPHSGLCGHLICASCLNRLSASVTGVLPCPSCRKAHENKSSYIKLHLGGGTKCLIGRERRTVSDSVEIVKNNYLVEASSCLKDWIRQESQSLGVIPRVVEKSGLNKKVPKIVNNLILQERIERLKFIQENIGKSTAHLEDILKCIGEKPQKSTNTGSGVG